MSELSPLFQITIILQSLLLWLDFVRITAMTFIIYWKRMVECRHTEAVTEDSGMYMVPEFKKIK